MISSDGFPGEAMEVDMAQGLQLVNYGLREATNTAVVIRVQSQRMKRACFRTISPRTGDRRESIPLLSLHRIGGGLPT